MTVSYTGDVANASAFGIFSKILIRWRGSVYKLVFKELLAYIAMYMIIQITYRAVLIPKSECDETLPSCERWKTHRELFESLRLYINQNLTSVPLIFVLGFYVSLIVKRWWHQYELLPWPDSFGMTLVGLFKVDKSEDGRKLRRNMMRYVILSYCIALRTVSFRLKKRFPTLEHLVAAGVMREDELRVFQALDEKVTANKWFLPLAWAAKEIFSLLSYAQMVGEGVENGNVQAPNGTTMMRQLGIVRTNLTTILSYDWISVPIVYTQVVTLAVYFYFMAALFGSQWVMPETDEMHKKIYKTTVRLDMFYPFFLTLQFGFYLGWLKVAETLINPFGEDDDDFELSRLIDRHIQVGYLICDPVVDKPDLLKDKFWNDIIPQEMLYTTASSQDKSPEFQGSAEVKLAQMKDSEKIYGERQIYSGETLYGKSLYSRAGTFRKRVRKSTETIYESIRSRKFSNKSMFGDRKKSAEKTCDTEDSRHRVRVSRSKSPSTASTSTTNYPYTITLHPPPQLPASPPPSPASMTYGPAPQRSQPSHETGPGKTRHQAEVKVRGYNGLEQRGQPAPHSPVPVPPTPVQPPTNINTVEPAPKSRREPTFILDDIQISKTYSIV